MKIRGLGGWITVRMSAKLVKAHLFGQFWPVKRLILIAPGQSPATEQATLWHEWLHSVFFDGHVKLSVAKAEQICDVVASALIACGAKPPIVK